MDEARKEQLGKLIVTSLVGIALVVAFAVSPLEGGDDWDKFMAASQRVWTRAPLYGDGTHTGYHNPPWLAVVLTPLALLPFRLGWALLSVATLVIVSAVMRRWGGGLFRTLLILLSPSIVYTLLHGQIDGLILGGILLPQEWWLLVGLTKPQVTLGLIFGIPRTKLLRAVAVVAVLLLISFVWLGNWPTELIRQPNPQQEGYNLWAGLWPFQVPVGVVLILLGITRKDERLLVAGSPFLSPYAAISSMLGPWAVACSFLSDWQALVVLMTWWGAVVFRLFV